jgi:ABC-type dipeptide/oligopeptide/nickel transport system permease component
MNISNSSLFSCLGLALGKITLRFLQLFLAFCVAILTGMTYLAYQGKFSDWHIQFNFSFWKYQPEPNTIFWLTLVFVIAMSICLIAFFLSRWLGEKI